MNERRLPETARIEHRGPNGEWIPVGTVHVGLVPVKTVDVRVTRADGSVTDETLQIMAGESLEDALVARFGAQWTAPCPACASNLDPTGPITDDACQCDVCGDGPMSGSYIHRCRGRRECERCHAQPMAVQQTTSKAVPPARPNPPDGPQP